MKTKPYYCAYPGRSAKNCGGAREAGVGAVNSVEAVGREEFVLTRNSKDANNRLFSIPNIRTHDSP